MKGYDYNYHLYGMSGYYFIFNVFLFLPSFILILQSWIEKERNINLKERLGECSSFERVRNDSYFKEATMR